MKFINPVTRQIKEIHSNEVKLFTDIQENKFSTPVKINEIFTLSDEDLIKLVIASGEWVIFENYEDWIEPTYNFRISGNGTQLTEIAENMPEFLVELNTEPKNPKIKFGQFWEVYINNFPTAESKTWLVEIGCIIKEKPVNVINVVVL